MRLSIIHLICWLSLLCNLALAQFNISEGLTGSTSFPNVALTSLGNLAIFLTCLVSGRLYAEMGGRDLLDWITGPRLLKIDEFGLTTCHFKSEKGHGRLVLNLRSAQVVMLSKDKPSCSMQFMKYTSRVYGVPSIQLQSRRLDSLEDIPEEIHRCSDKHIQLQSRPEGCRPEEIRNCFVPSIEAPEEHGHQRCKCIVFKAEKEIRMMVVERMPGTLRKLPDSRWCLLPCLSCLTNDCNGCDQGLLYVEGVEEKERPGKGWPFAVCQILDEEGTAREEFNSCICIRTRG